MKKVTQVRKNSVGAKGDALVRLRERLAHGVPDVAEFLGISPSAVRGLISRGDLEARRVGGGSERIYWLVPTPSIEAWLQGSKELKS